MCIYIINPICFQTQGPSFEPSKKKRPPRQVTARGLEYGYDYWGNFVLALYTMFQVFTQEPHGGSDGATC